MKERKTISPCRAQRWATLTAGGALIGLIAACSSTSREFTTETAGNGGGSNETDTSTMGGGSGRSGGSGGSQVNASRAGASGKNPDTACQKGERRCENSTTALVCNSDQSGFDRDECGTATCIAGRCESGLIAYFQFDEVTGTTTKDAVGGVPGKLEGASLVDGRVGKAVRFDDAGERVNFDDVFNDSIRYPLTLAIWVYLDGTGWGNNFGWGTLFVSENRSDYCGIQWAVHPTAVILTAGKCGGGSDPLNRRDFRATFPQEAKGEWLHLVSVATAHNRDFVHYLDGQHLQTGIADDAGYTGEIASADSEASSGSALWGNTRRYELNGRIDELKIYDRELSAIEVEALYESY